MSALNPELPYIFHTRKQIKFLQNSSMNLLDDLNSESPSETLVTESLYKLNALERFQCKHSVIYSVNIVLNTNLTKV